MFDRIRPFVLGVICLLVLFAVPLYADAFWIQLLLVTLAMATAAMGLTLLVGVAGQLSLAHAFFMAVGAYTYAALASQPDELLLGAGLPPAVAAVAAVLVTGLLGGLFSPISERLRGLYLGVASLGLVFLGQYVLTAWRGFSGGYDGRRIPTFELFGITFDNQSGVVIAGVPFGRLEMLWLLAAIVFGVLLIGMRRLLRSRRGLEFSMVRVSEEAAEALGIDVRGAKRNAFIVSSLYAGVGGVLLALALQRVVPETFGLHLSVNLLAMIVIGGMRSAWGAVLGAMFVTALPMMLQRYSSVIPFIAPPGSGGVDAAILATYVYGVLIIVVLVVWPSGLAGMLSAIASKLRRRRTLEVENEASENEASEEETSTTVGR